MTAIIPSRVGLVLGGGMTVGLARARARGAYGGRTYLFCSENCRDAFLRSPEKYLASARRGAEA